MLNKVNKTHKYMLIISGILRCNDTIEFPTIEYDVCCACAQIGFRQCPAHPSADDSSFTIQSENEIEISLRYQFFIFENISIMNILYDFIDIRYGVFWERNDNLNKGNNYINVTMVHSCPKER